MDLFTFKLLKIIPIYCFGTVSFRKPDVSYCKFLIKILSFEYKVCYRK